MVSLMRVLVFPAPVLQSIYATQDLAEALGAALKEGSHDNVHTRAPPPIMIQILSRHPLLQSIPPINKGRYTIISHLKTAPFPLTNRGIRSSLKPTILILKKIKII
jgi:hypothetical protein